MSSSHGLRGTQGINRACLSVYLRLSREYSDAADGLCHFRQDDALGSSVPPTTDRVGATYVALLWHRFVSYLPGFIPPLHHHQVVMVNIQQPLHIV